MGTEILLAIVAGAEGLLGLLLASHPLSPTLAYPALSICRGLSSGGSGKASVATLEVGFLVFLFVALNDIRALNASVPAGAESTENR